MKSSRKISFLEIAMYAIGMIFLFGIYPLMVYWPSGWQWFPNQPEYEQMILGGYAALGFFLIRGASNPLSHLRLIWFTACSSLVYCGIMAYQAWVNADEFGHFYGDIPALLLVFIVLTCLAPKKINT